MNEKDLRYVGVFDAALSESHFIIESIVLADSYNRVVALATDGSFSDVAQFACKLTQSRAGLTGTVQTATLGQFALPLSGLVVVIASGLFGDVESQLHMCLPLLQGWVRPEGRVILVTKKGSCVKSVNLPAAIVGKVRYVELVSSNIAIATQVLSELDL